MDREIKIRFFTAFFVTFVLIVLGTVFFNMIEGWSYINSFYYTVASLTTMGVVMIPTTETGLLLTSIFSLLGVGVFLFFIAVVSEHFMYRRMEDIECSLLRDKKKHVRHRRTTHKRTTHKTTKKKTSRRKR